MMLNKKTIILKLLLILAIAITVIGFIFDLHNTLSYPGTDLRNRVVGARLALEGIDPYFFKWHPGMPEIFYDPMDKPEEILSKLSVPPTVLALHAPLAIFSYRSQKVIWFIVQWSVFAGILVVFYNSSKSKIKRNLVLLLGFAFANSLFWRFHVNSGQIYIIYIGLLSISWLLLNQQFKYKEVASGFFAGITAGLRPPYILFFLFFLINRKYSFIIGGIAGILFIVLSSIAVAGTFIWQQYSLAMMSMTGFINLEKAFPKLREDIIAQISIHSQIVEGVDFKIRNPLEEHLFSNSALYEVFTAMDLSGKKEILVVGFIFTFAILCWFGIKYGMKQKDQNLTFLFSTVICLISEFFIPVGRYSYYDIQWLLPLLIIFTTVSTKKLVSNKLILLLIAGLVLSMGYFTWIPNSLFYSTYLIAGYVAILTLILIKQKGQKPKSWLPDTNI